MVHVMKSGCGISTDRAQRSINRFSASQTELKGLCEVTPLADEHYEVKVNLTAESAPIEVGGYIVVTENYNGAYMPLVIEAMPGDTVAALLENRLMPRKHEPMGLRFAKFGLQICPPRGGCARNDPGLAVARRAPTSKAT